MGDQLKFVSFKFLQPAINMKEARTFELGATLAPLIQGPEVIHSNKQPKNVQLFKVVVL